LILNVTEGSVTEPEYLKGFSKASRNPRVDIEVVDGAGVPKSIVEKAKELKRRAETRARRENDRNLAYDEVCCVFDVDEHHRIPDARQMAQNNGIQLAVSNPCFELWLLLHFAEPPGMKHRDDLKKKMRKHVANYDKHVDYSSYAGGYRAAVNRASKLDKQAETANEPWRNPTTGVWRLTESIETPS
jgi:hypothetical protein